MTYLQCCRDYSTSKQRIEKGQGLKKGLVPVESIIVLKPMADAIKGVLFRRNESLFVAGFREVRHRGLLARDAYRERIRRHK